MILSTSRTLALAIIAPAVSLLPSATPAHVQALSSGQAAALHASFDPSLGALRAGRVDAPRALAASTRAGLQSAQQGSSSLAAMRAGFEPSDNEWKWLGIGAVVVLLIVLL